MELGEVARLGTIVAMTVLARPERERVGPPEAMAANAPHVGAAAVLDDGRAAGRAESDLSLTTRDATELVNIRARQRARGGPSRGSPLGRLGTQGSTSLRHTRLRLCLGWPLDRIPSVIYAVLGQAWRRVFARRKDASNALLVGGSFSCSYPRPRRREVVHFLHRRRWSSAFWLSIAKIWQSGESAFDHGFRPRIGSTGMGSCPMADAVLHI